MPVLLRRAGGEQLYRSLNRDGPAQIAAPTHDQKEVIMKKITLLATIVLAITMSASAQDIIDFSHLSAATTPQPIANGYAGLKWTAIDYVSVPLYENWLASHGYAESDGMKTGPEAQVALIGGPLCYQKHGGTTIEDICRGSISASASAVFQPEYLIASEGWSSDGPQFVTVMAYNNGQLVGSQKFNLGVNAQKFKLVLSNSWGEVTQLVLYPSPGGSVVLYVVGMK